MVYLFFACLINTYDFYNLKSLTNDCLLPSSLGQIGFFVPKMLGVFNLNTSSSSKSTSSDELGIFVHGY